MYHSSIFHYSSCGSTLWGFYPYCVLAIGVWVKYCRLIRSGMTQVKDDSKAHPLLSTKD
jgi:hypothetical protein